MGMADRILKGFSSIVPLDADASAVADAIVHVVDTPLGKRPFRVHIDSTQDGAEVVNAVEDRVRAELLSPHRSCRASGACGLGVRQAQAIPREEKAMKLTGNTIDAHEVNDWFANGAH